MNQVGIRVPRTIEEFREASREQLEKCRKSLKRIEIDLKKTSRTDKKNLAMLREYKKQVLRDIKDYEKILEKIS